MFDVVGGESHRPQFTHRVKARFDERVNHERLSTEIVRQSELLAADIADADLAVPVPSCPGWNVGQLVRHVDGGHRWAAELVRTRARKPIPDISLRDLSAFTDEDPAALGPTLIEGAQALAGVLREAGPDAEMWTPVPSGRSGFFARRFAHETAIHRADAVLALDGEFMIDPEIAIDGIDEWLELGSLPFHFDVHPWMRELLAPGRSLGLRAVDADADWVVDLTGDAITWRRSDETTPVTVSGAVTELLLMIYKRRPPVKPHVQVTGDGELLDFWLQRVDFG
jgi:uncharacterized protein (TIGR03083 family)